MKRLWQKYGKWCLTLVAAVAVFLVCLYPLRALLNYYEETHLFRWTSYYFHEQGLWEYLVSFVTQFFYVGALGSAIVALLFVGLQLVVWGLMRWAGLRHTGFWLLSFLPSLLLFCLVFIPANYRNDGEFREIVQYDYLVRTHQWDSILRRSMKETPQTDCGVWCTNYALAMRGELVDRLMDFQQIGGDGLLTDKPQRISFALCSMSDILLQLGCVNDAERVAFDIKQYLPDDRKSGRLYRRLAEANIINGDWRVAAKYLRSLESTLFYRSYAKRWLAALGDERQVESAYGRVLQLRQKENHWLLSNAKELMLAELVAENPQNQLAMNYLLAFRILRLGQMP